MKKTIQAVLFACALPVFAWAALSVYFLLAGRDSQGDCFCEYSPDSDSCDRIRALKPEENMLTHLKWLNDNMPTNTTLLSTDHRLRTAYLNGTTNRLEFTDAARDYLAERRPAALPRAHTPARLFPRAALTPRPAAAEGCAVLKSEVRRPKSFPSIRGDRPL
ncbi:MAG: hypothetical protein IJ173_05505 [Kiritimatiellae bacterium]|nr:hypothetical protein [Kiritimatiellia bacterium]